MSVCVRLRGGVAACVCVSVWMREDVRVCVSGCVYECVGAGCVRECVWLHGCEVCVHA